MYNKPTLKHSSAFPFLKPKGGFLANRTDIVVLPLPVIAVTDLITALEVFCFSLSYCIYILMLKCQFSLNFTYISQAAQSRYLDTKSRKKNRELYI